MTQNGIHNEIHMRMAQGMGNAPATFQRVLHLVLHGLAWDKVLIYLDNVIVLGKSLKRPLKMWIVL